MKINDIESIKFVWPIQPKPPMDFELRVVIWECEDVPASDIEDTSDLYITACVGNEI